MSNTQVTPHPEEAENYGYEILAKFTVEEIERSNAQHSQKHDETFYDETTTSSEKITVTFPATKAVSQDSGEVLTKEELQQRITDNGNPTIERTDFDESHVTIDGETFVVTYDTSDAPEM